jgi:hypothetical protein
MIEETKTFLLSVFMGSVLGLAIFTFQPVYYKATFLVFPPPSLSKENVFVEDTFTTIERIKSFTFKSQIVLSNPDKRLDFINGDGAIYTKPTRNNDAIYCEVKGYDREAVLHTADAVVETLNLQLAPSFDRYKIKIDDLINRFSNLKLSSTSKDGFFIISTLTDYNFIKANLKYTLAFKPMVKECRYIEYLWVGIFLGISLVFLLFKLFKIVYSKKDTYKWKA